ncbi:MAG: gamma-glutamyltransferase, partial [Gemmatimonadota bacterium]|nr:gamma-glutamyltransferase [Gemmatimonadota bacterium]
MPRVAIASISQLAARAGARVADEGGNAVDAAVAAAVVSCVTAPGMCSLGGAGFAIVGGPGGPPEAIDAGFEMPGRGLPPSRFGGGRMDVHLEYGGGVDTNVGPGSVATPGALALFDRLADRYGLLHCSSLIRPAYEHARDGFPLPAAAHEYMTYAHEAIFGWNEDSFAALHDDEGRLLPAGAAIHVPHLAESLQRIASEGARVFYEGGLGRDIARYVEEHGGLLRPADLEAYRVVGRAPVVAEYRGWDVATNPPPAVGGVVLAAMLELLERGPAFAWSPEDAARLARVQASVLLRRAERLDASRDLDAEARALLEAASSGTLPDAGSSSTVHTSTVDDDGLACAITLSDGYGSGAMAPGTGIWLNTCLGEPELNPHGYHGWPPGQRLLSNMAPTLARRGDAVLAIGSPGADRITTAVLQVLVNVLELGMTLEEAIDH